MLFRSCTGIDRIEAMGDGKAAVTDIEDIVGAGDETPFMFNDPGDKLGPKSCDLWKPVIAAVNGIAFGGGCEITEAVHLAIASDQALFAKPEINLGMPPTFGGTQRLPRLAGRKRALELLLTGDTFSPARALEIGLINQVVPHAELMRAARSLAARIMRHSPLAAGGIIAAVTRGLNMEIAEGLQMESEQFARMIPTHDLGEGLAAWIARRKPVYVGR